jgi:hypothetical protein
VEVVPVAEPGPAAAPAEQEIEEAFVDPIEEFLNQLPGQDYILRVDRLPYFDNQGRFGRGATRKFCGELTFDLDYLTTMQSCFGPGSYSLTLFDGARHIVKRWPEHIDAPAATAPAALQFPAQPRPGPAPVSPVQQVGELANFAEQLNTIRDAMGWGPPAQSQVITPQVPEKTAEERQLELLLALVGKNESIAAPIIDRFFGPPAKEPGIMEFLAEVAKPLMPYIVQSMAAAANAARVQQPGQGPSPAAAPGPEPAAQLAGPPGLPQIALVPSPGQEDQPEYFTEDEEPYMELLTNLIALIAECTKKENIDKILVERGAEWVRAFEREQPIYWQMFKGFLSGHPSTVLSSLAMIMPEAAPLMHNRFAHDFVAALQAELVNNPSQPGAATPR